jgi:hypothetical protein
VFKPSPIQPHPDLNFIPRIVNFPGGPKLEFCFDQPQLSSDGGVLLAACDPQALALVDRLAGCIRMGRRKCRHENAVLMRQRVLSILAGYYDTNDATELRHEPVMQAAVGLMPGAHCVLASQPSLSRLENEVSRTDLMRLFYEMIDVFLDSYEGRPPPMIVLDLDPTAVITTPSTSGPRSPFTRKADTLRLTRTSSRTPSAPPPGPKRRNNASNSRRHKPVNASSRCGSRGLQLKKQTALIATQCDVYLQAD